MSFVPVAKTSDIADPGSLLVEVDEQLVVVFHVDGEFYAVDDICTASLRVRPREGQ